MATMKRIGTMSSIDSSILQASWSMDEEVEIPIPASLRERPSIDLEKTINPSAKKTINVFSSLLLRFVMKGRK